MWENVKRIDSADSNVSKYVFSKKTAVAEAVLYKYESYEQRAVVCCSTQSGCPVGCRFCGAGDNFVRSLTAEEIISQTEYLFTDRHIDHSRVERMQIMFMSMGEPLLNFKELAIAIRELNRKFPRAALLISTSGPRVDYGPVCRLSSEVDRVGLQFSVHESTDEARNQLIPFEAKLTLKEIAEQGEVWFRATGRRPFFNYCAHEKNSCTEDAARLEALFNPEIWEATISVVCERDESVAAANYRQRELAIRFQKLLGDRGFSTRVFDPAGQDDIGGGCGQLFHYQNWLRQNPSLVKPSIGRGLPILHMPK